jgi:uncharacterized C2H2 Zn-finger protein
LGETDEVRCERCAETFARREELESHWVSAHEIDREDTIRCSRCGAEFEARGQLDKHVREQHPSADRPRGEPGTSPEPAGGDKGSVA